MKFALKSTKRSVYEFIVDLVLYIGGGFEFFVFFIVLTSMEALEFCKLVCPSVYIRFQSNERYNL